jgi:hypothetical protein
MILSIHRHSRAIGPRAPFASKAASRLISGAA